MDDKKNFLQIQHGNKETLYYSNAPIQDWHRWRYVLYKLQYDKDKKHKTNEIYLDSIAHYGPLSYEMTNVANNNKNKRRIFDNELQYCDTKPTDAVWSKTDEKNEKSHLDGIEHITYGLYEHGDENGFFRNLPSNIIEKNLDSVDDKYFKNLKSFYFKSYSCHGAYRMGNTNVFKELQKKMKRCGNKNVKCFFSALKPEYEMILGGYYNNKNKSYGIIRTPFAEDTKFDIDEIREHKDDYFNYFYITEDAIYKIPHLLVKNRVELLDDNKFQDEFDKLRKEGKIEKVENIDLYYDGDKVKSNKNLAYFLFDYAEQEKKDNNKEIFSENNIEMLKDSITDGDNYRAIAAYNSLKQNDKKNFVDFYKYEIGKLNERK